LAALCLVLDQDRPEVLEKFGLSGMGADKHLLKKDNSIENMLMNETGGDSGSTPPVLSKSPAGGEVSRGLGIILTEGKAKILNAVWNEDDCSLQLSVEYGQNKSLTYNLQIDDAIRVITSPEIKAQIPKKIQSVVSSTYTATRVFDCRKHGQSGVQIYRTVVIKDSAGRVRKNIQLDGLDVRCVGRLGVFVPKSGLVLFKDDMSIVQVARWEEYPRVASLDNDTAALLIETGFDRLRETAEVKIAPWTGSFSLNQPFGVLSARRLIPQKARHRPSQLRSVSRMEQLMAHREVICLFRFCVPAQRDVNLSIQNRAGSGYPTNSTGSLNVFKQMVGLNCRHSSS
jgi:hypothetical protein